MLYYVSKLVSERRCKIIELSLSKDTENALKFVCCNAISEVFGSNQALPFANFIMAIVPVFLQYCKIP